MQLLACRMGDLGIVFIILGAYCFVGLFGLILTAWGWFKSSFRSSIVGTVIHVLLITPIVVLLGRDPAHFIHDVLREIEYLLICLAVVGYTIACFANLIHQIRQKYARSFSDGSDLAYTPQPNSPVVTDPNPYRPH
jgi:hypothetical protein